MTVVHGSGAALFTGTPLPETHESVNVDNAIHLDNDDPDHLIRIVHTKFDGKDILAAVDKNSNTKSAYIDSGGDLHCNNVHYGSPLQNMGTNIDLLEGRVDVAEGDIDAIQAVTSSIETIVQAAHADDDGIINNLVKRDQADGTEIDNLHVIASATNYTRTFPPPGLFFTHGTCTASLDLISDAAVGFQPYTSNGSPIVSRTFAFGRAVPEGNETTETADHRRDGLLIQDDAVDHSCEIMCSNELPTIRLVGDKATVTEAGFVKPVCPVVEVQDGGGVTVRGVRRRLRPSEGALGPGPGRFE